MTLLGDVFATPSWSPVHSVFSIGDILIVIGVAVFLHMTCRHTDRSGSSERTATVGTAPGAEVMSADL